MMYIKINVILKRRGISILEMSRDLNVRYNTLHEIVNNKVKRVNLNYLHMMMEYLGIDDMNEAIEYIPKYKLKEAK